MWKIIKKSERYFEFLLPSFFLLNVFSNIIAYYFTGNTIDIVRKIVSWGIVLCINILAVIVFWGLFKFHSKKIIFASIPFGINLLIIVFACLKYDLNTFVLEKLLLFILYCFPPFVSALYVVIRRKISVVFSNSGLIGLILLPFFISCNIQFVSMSFTGNYYDRFGGIVYLSISYAALIILCLCFADVYCSIFKSKESIERRHLWVNIIVIAVCSATVISSGSRGALVAIVAWYIATLSVITVKKCRNKTISILTIIIPVIVISLIAITNFGQTKVNRITGFVKEVQNDSIEKALSSNASEEIIKKIQEGAEEGYSLEETIDEMTENGNLNINQEMQSELDSITKGSMSRIYLFRLAIKEANNHIGGLGPLGYQIKYGTYPHNIVLECMADFGYCIAIVVLAFMLYLIILLCKYTKYSNKFLWVLLISIGQVARVMLSVDLYIEPYLIWFVTLILSTHLLQKNIKEID